MLYRGVVRDNGYREASVCVDVRRSPSSLLFYLPLGDTSWTMEEVAWMQSSDSGYAGDGFRFGGKGSQSGRVWDNRSGEGSWSYSRYVGEVA